jgi:hypothetical protein
LVGLVVLVALLVVADRVAAWAAQRTLAERVAEELSAHQVGSSQPEVSIGGFPFLTQVASGRYERVVLRLRDVGSEQLRLPLVELTATGVTASARAIIERQGAVEADRVTGTATVGYAQVRALIGRDDLQLRGEDGRIALRLPVELLGVPVTLVGVAGAEMAGNVIQVRVREFGIESGGLPEGAFPLVDQIARELSVDVALPPLPYGLSVDSVFAGPTGLVVSVSAAEVPLSR